MRVNTKNYDEWLSELIEVAAQDGIDLSLDKYHYHTFFMRGWLSESVIADIKERTK